MFRLFKPWMEIVDAGWALMCVPLAASIAAPRYATEIVRRACR